MLSRSLLIVPALIPLALACGGGAAEPDTTLAPDALISSDTAQVASGCEDALVHREALPRCDGETCAQVRREPQRTVHWYLSLQHDDPVNGYQYADRSSEVLEHQIDCVLRQLQSLGVEPHRQEGSAPRQYDAITVDASFGQIESVLRTEVVNGAELSCVEADCQRCETLAEAECRADAFCSPMDAQRLDASRECWEPRFAGCYRGQAICGGALTNGISADGACWLFSSTCQPRGFSGSGSTAPACGYASFDGVPQCEQ